MKILIIGDIFGKCGRKAIIDNLKDIKKKNKIDFVIANGENVSHGKSMSIEHYNILKSAGIDFFTMGNHTWDNDEVYYLLQNHNDIIRPFNIDKTKKQGKIGEGTKVIECKDKTIRITNILGMAMQCHDLQANSFLALKEIIKLDKSDIHIVDFHAETTSEKKAFFLEFRGKVSLIYGTHTHVQTADEQISNDTGFITDIGMTGSKYSIIGAEPKEILAVFKEEAKRFHIKSGKGEYQFNAIIVEFDNKTNKIKFINKCNINNN